MIPSDKHHSTRKDRPALRFLRLRAPTAPASRLQEPPQQPGLRQRWLPGCARGWWRYLRVALEIRFPQFL